MTFFDKNFIFTWIIFHVSYFVQHSREQLLSVSVLSSDSFRSKCFGLFCCAIALMLSSFRVHRKIFKQAWASLMKGWLELRHAPSWANTPDKNGNKWKMKLSRQGHFTALRLHWSLCSSYLSVNLRAMPILGNVVFSNNGHSSWFALALQRVAAWASFYTLNPLDARIIL